MDHLILPPGSVTTLNIPFVCDCVGEYDGSDFFDFPKHKRWNTEPGNELQWTFCPEDELASRVQLWLFFGTLSEFCGRVVKTEELRSHGSAEGLSALKTENLAKLIHARRARTVKTRAEERDRFQRRLRDVLVRVSWLSEIVELRVEGGQTTLALVSCSVRSLLQTLISIETFDVHYKKSLAPAGIIANSLNLRHSAHQNEKAGIIPGWVADSFTVHPAKAIKHAMAASGWCPSQIHHFSQSLSNAATYYLSGILQGTWRSMEHGSCTDLKCFAMNINKDDYTQQHHTECSAQSATAIGIGAPVLATIGGNCCPPINVNPDDLASIIGDRGGIPLLSCFMNRSGRLQARVIRADFRTEYVAISHVWAGGMGNPKVNGLPKCQILRLYHLVRSILAFTSSRTISVQRNRVSQNAPVNLWIDTLCIPVPQSLQSYRDKAIDLLPETYSNARTVLVLDPELQSIQHKGVAIELILARVQSSPWMSRYWTLREASLSRSLYIQFADGALNAGKLLHEAEALVEKLASARPGTGKWERRYLVAELARALLEMDGVCYQSRDQEYRRFDWSLKLLEENQAHSFAQTWNNLLGRDTSRIEDLHQILAGMQDINLAAIRPYRPEDRMKAILKSHATLPVDLLFCRSEKIPNVKPVNAWAPMYPQGQRLNYYLGCMRVHTDCLLLHPFVTSRLHVCTVDSSVFSHLKFILNLDDTDRFWVERSVQNSVLPLTEKENHFVLLFPKVDDRSMTRFDHKCDGALFKITKREHKSLWLMYASSVQVFAYHCSHLNSSQGCTHGEPPSLSAEREEDGMRIFVDCCKYSAVRRRNYI